MSVASVLVILSIFVLLMVIIALFHAPYYPSYCGGVDQEVTTTTVVTTDDQQPVVGNLKRHVEGHQLYVIDPVDKDKVYVNDTDDMYEDGGGRIWRLY